MDRLPQSLAALHGYNQFILVGSDKVPVAGNPHDSENWLDADTAIRLANEQGHCVGFVFTANDPFWFLDIDHCYVNGEWNETAQHFLTVLNGAAVEVSQSGEGLHLIGSNAAACGPTELRMKKNKELGIELYTEGRFVLLTGTHASGDVSFDAGAALPDIVNRYFPRSATTDLAWSEHPVPEWNGPTDDEVLLAKMMSTGPAFGGSITFADLWNNNEAKLAQRYPSENDVYDRSSADAALFNRLAFWTGKNHKRMWEIGCKSGLYRAKWHPDKHKSYLKNTILNAANSCRNVYGQKELSVDAEQLPVPLDPLPDQTQPVMPFSADMLPAGPMAPFVMDVSERMQCPPDYIAVPLLTALGASIGRKFQVQPKEEDTGWVVVPNLWGLIIGRPSQLKTPAVEAALEPLKRIEARENEKFIGEVKRYKLANEFHDIKLQEMHKNVRALLRNDRVSEAENLYRQRELEVGGSNSEPVRRRFIVNDSTVEKLGELLRDNPNGLLLYRDEMSGFLRTINDEKRPNDRAFYLEGFNGTGSYRYDRIGRGTIDIDHLVLSVLGSIQPGNYYEYINQALRQGTGDDGLAQRFQLVVNPDEPKHWANVDRKPDEAARQGVFDLFETIVARQVGSDGQIFRFTPAAQQRFDQWRFELENQKLRSTDDHPALISHLAKYRSLVPSLALIIHICESYQQDIMGSITEDAVAKAILWASYLESHARRIYHAAASDSVRPGQLILKKIKQGKIQSGFKAREIYRNRWAGLTEPEEVKKGLDVLVDHGYLQEDILRTGGRPTSQYFINPAIRATDKRGQ